MDGVRKRNEEIVNGGGELNHWEYGLSVAREMMYVMMIESVSKYTP